MKAIAAWGRRYRGWLSAAVTALAIVFAWPVARDHWDAVALLSRAQRGGGEPAITFGVVEIEESAFELSSAGERIPARRYLPKGVARAPGVVLLHGVHRLGIDEPRLTAFARSLARAGLVVLTPELTELVSYRIEASSIPKIGAAARALAESEGVRPGGVALMGFSFAGGLALSTAAEPAYAPFVKTVLAVGAHGSLDRVARFFATNEARYPDGRALTLKAHDYGALVLIHGHTGDFFDEEDAKGAGRALEKWLSEDWDGARGEAGQLSPEGRARLEGLFEGKLDAVSGRILDFTEQNIAKMRAASPEGRLDAMRAKVFLLHGAGDSVVPATEAYFLERDLPEAAKAELLVSPAVQHVEAGKDASFVEQLELVHFIANLLASLR